MATVSDNAIQDEDVALEYFSPVETHLIRSRHVAQQFSVRVMQPAQPKGTKTRLPVVYATDGNFAFDVLKGISYSMQRNRRDAACFILVGIGYPSAMPLAGAVLRARDLTFPGFPKQSTSPAPVEGILLPENATKDYYGAEDFQRFIGDELIPMIDQSYQTLTGERAYFGHSAGGSFGLFTLFTRRELFNRYIISSPGLIYHGESTAGIVYDNHDFLLQRARNYFAAHQRLTDIRLYMSVGAEEEYEPSLEKWRMTSSFHRMAALIRSAAIPGLEFTGEVLPGETHMTAWPIAFVHGVKAVMGLGNHVER